MLFGADASIPWSANKRHERDRRAMECEALPTDSFARGSQSAMGRLGDYHKLANRRDSGVASCHVNFKTGAVTIRAATSKGRRDEIDKLPQTAIDHLKGLPGFGALIFEWPEGRKKLWEEFRRIQTAAGIELPCPDEDKHKCTTACHRYGFHALRRAYATLNVNRLDAPTLQRKMSHKAFATTLGYINLANRMQESAAEVFVPDVLKAKVSG